MAPSKEVAVVGSKELASIDPDQTLKASKALLAHIKKAAAAKDDDPKAKRSLLGAEVDAEDTPIWLTLTTKRHISDKARLQPGKIPLPYPLHDFSSASEGQDDALPPTTTVCLITADPQRAYKDIVEEFPAPLRRCVTRVIGFSKLKSKFSQYEAQRKLFSEHDVFLGDERIINRLPGVLGKTFYKTTQKRPVPVNLQPKPERVDGKRVKPEKNKKKQQAKGDGEKAANAGTPAQLAKEVEKALGSALVHLSPATNTAIRIGYAHWPADHIAANVAAVGTALIEKWVPQRWRNVKSVYIKGPETAALPIWLTDELWMDGAMDVVADNDPRALAATEKANVGRKRKAIEDVEKKDAKESKEESGSKRQKKGKISGGNSAKALPDGDDAALDAKIADRKANLRKQKSKASKAMDD